MTEHKFTDEEVIRALERKFKAEAVKEFAERLKTYYRNIDKTAGALINYTIDQKLKEFLGEGGGKENG